MDFTKPIKSQFVWCVDCQEEVILDLELLNGEPIHTVIDWCPNSKMGFGVVEPDYHICFGPFTSCPPPDNFEEDWDIDLVEPSQEELAEMNLQAEVLLQELEDVEFPDENYPTAAGHGYGY